MFFFIYSYALPALMSFDLAGILLRWKMFDHFVSLYDSCDLLIYINNYMY